MHLHTVRTVHPDHTLVSLYGEADVLTAPLVRRALGQALRGADGRRVVADLCGIGFIDSSGAAPLVQADQVLHAQGKRLWLACLSPRTGRMLRGIRLAGFFPVLPATVPLPRCAAYDGHAAWALRPAGAAPGRTAGSGPSARGGPPRPPGVAVTDADTG